MSRVGRRSLRRGYNSSQVRYRPDVTKPPVSSSYGEDWVTISALVRRRDNYTCQAHKIGLPKCNNRFPPPYHHLLHAHHIIPWIQCRNNHPKNLVTLCKDCHSKEHGKSFGKKITRKQKLAVKY